MYRYIIIIIYRLSVLPSIDATFIVVAVLLNTNLPLEDFALAP